MLAEPVMLLTFIPKAFGSNINRDTEYSEVFRGALSPSRQVPEQCIKIRPRPLSSKFFPIHYSLYDCGLLGCNIVWLCGRMRTFRRIIGTRSQNYTVLQPTTTNTP
jgi:hypothetical protein